MVLLFFSLAKIFTHSQKNTSGEKNSNSLGPLVGRLSDARARHLLSSLAGLLIIPEEAARDVGAIALRTVIAEATAAPAASCSPISPRLLVMPANPDPKALPMLFAI